MQIEIKRPTRELGVSIIYVTHDQDEALVMSDRIAVFNHGRIEQAGPPRSCYTSGPPDALRRGLSSARPTLIRAQIVQFDGATAVMEATAAGACGADAQAQLARERRDALVRPERMRIEHLAGAVAKPANNVVTGTLTDIIYLGNARRYMVVWHPGARSALRSRAAPAPHYNGGKRSNSLGTLKTPWHYRLSSRSSRLATLARLAILFLLACPGRRPLRSHRAPWTRPRCLARAGATPGHDRRETPVGWHHQTRQQISAQAAHPRRPIRPAVLAASATPLGGWLQGLLKRMHKNAAVVALANKLARIVWAVLRRGAAFDAAAVRARQPNRDRPSKAGLPLGR